MHGGTETILLVEDEMALRELARRVLIQRGYRVLAADSGAEALEVWRGATGKIDLLLTDMVMPGGMSGRDLAQRLVEEQPDLRVIYTSGYSVDLMGQDSTLKGDLVFLAKPYQSQELTRLVRNVLDGRENGAPQL
jgi:CheY-like chemotaxis protein